MKRYSREEIISMAHKISTDILYSKSDEFIKAIDTAGSINEKIYITFATAQKNSEELISELIYQILKNN